MCGISGIISKNNGVSIKDALYKMSSAISHRGPDGEGFAFFKKGIFVTVFSDDTPLVNKESKKYLFNPSVNFADAATDLQIGFAHRRLSIIDLSESGHQPMCDTSSKYWVTFNGEIYNYVELKALLISKGHQFVTQTDTEVLIEAYKEWGTDCLQYFNGMFAFALLDIQKQIVFCARDRAGVKPFYYGNNSQAFSFASEYKAFIKSGLINFEINEQEQFDFIVNANLETHEHSLFNGIIELKPAHFLCYNVLTHHFKITEYYAISNKISSEKSDAEIIETIEEKLVNAINLRLRSDVNIGACLSGGLDSSIIAGIVKHLQPEKYLKLFTAVFPGESFDESNYAKLAAKSVEGSWQTVSPTATEFFRDIEKLNYFQDLPVWSTSTYSQHRVMELASLNNIKVVLDGQGADELFGGYSHHYFALWKQWMNAGRFDKVRNSVRQSKATIPGGYGLFAKQLIKDRFGLSVNYVNYFSEKSEYGKSRNQKIASTLNGQLKFDYENRLKSFLKCEDRCSMAFGIESRVPFADDIELVNLLFSIDGTKKIQHGISKYLLRQAAKRYIPKPIYERRDKVGFETPVGNWFAPFKAQVIDTITAELDFLKNHALEKNYDEMLKKKPTFILRLYSFAIWKSVFRKLN